MLRFVLIYELGLERKSKEFSDTLPLCHSGQREGPLSLCIVLPCTFLGVTKLFNTGKGEVSVYVKKSIIGI